MNSRSVASDSLTKCIQAMISLNIYKNSANKFGRKTGFKIENEIEDQDQSIPKLIGTLTQVFCTFGPNLVILAWTGDELSCRQAQNGVTFDFEVKFDLEGQGQSTPKTIGIDAGNDNTRRPKLASGKNMYIAQGKQYWFDSVHCCKFASQATMC